MANPIDDGERKFLEEMKDEIWWPWIGDDSGDPFIAKWCDDWLEMFAALSPAEQEFIERNWEECVLLPFHRARKRRLA